jgi:hypothetical protein
LSETLVWLLYVIGGMIAYAAVRYRGWRITLATLTGAIIATGLWALWYHLTSDEERPHWFDVHLSLNASFSVIFAALGAAAGLFVASRDRS